MTADAAGETLLPSFVFTGNQLRSSQDSLSTVVSRGLSSIEQRDRLGRIYASDGGRCERAGALLAQLPSNEVKSASLMAYARLGDAIEFMIVDAINSQHELLFRQYHLPEVGLNLGGYVDAIIYHRGRLRVLEVKSCSKLPKEPKPLHAAQTSIYSAITGLPAILFYMSRSVANYNGELMTTQFDLAQSAPSQREALWRVAYARLAYQAGLTPRLPNHLHSAADCGFCPFIDVCWNGAEAPSWPPEVSPSKHVELSREATTLTDHLLDPEVIANRRRGVLNHIARHGTPEAVALLSGPGSHWDDLVGGGGLEIVANTWTRETDQPGDSD